MQDFYFIFEIIKQEYTLILVFFMIALVYSSVGFGGGSSYSAVLSLTSLPFIEVRAISLLCNIVVVSNNTIQFLKNHLINFKKVLPLILFSVPFAFLGGFLKIHQRIFYLVLGLSLIIAAFLMLWNNYFFNEKHILNDNKHSFFKNAFIGGVIGFLSGMVGIGGGVFLAPLLHLIRWDSPKKIMATSSLFILVNSISGLIGQMQNPLFKLNIPLTIVLITAVFFGGLIGANLSLKKLKAQNIKFITALLIALVGVKLIYTHIQ